jgi:hypothetical protein
MQQLQQLLRYSNTLLSGMMLTFYYQQKLTKHLKFMRFVWKSVTTEADLPPWRWKMTTVGMQYDIEKTECHMKLSAKKMCSNG